MRSVQPNDAFESTQAKLASPILKRIDLNTSPAILEKLIQYEAVHKIYGWRDLRRRLAIDRRCYAFFDPVVTHEPIIFIEAALVRGLSSRIQPLVDPDEGICPPEIADSAIFYSITKCQDGLRGIPFGGLLIRHVLRELSIELPHLRRFATLSPIPGFRAWLRQAANSFHSGQARMLTALSKEIEQPSWVEYDDIQKPLRRVLLPLCAHYLLYVKNGREPLDSVARFHLRNGARLEKLNWFGDTSATGVDRSATIMANYLYRPGTLERNHEIYMNSFDVIASSRVRALSRSCTLSKQK